MAAEKPQWRAEPVILHDKDEYVLHEIANNSDFVRCYYDEKAEEWRFSHSLCSHWSVSVRPIAKENVETARTFALSMFEGSIRTAHRSLCEFTGAPESSKIDEAKVKVFLTEDEWAVVFDLGAKNRSGGNFSYEEGELIKRARETNEARFQHTFFAKE